MNLPVRTLAIVLTIAGAATAANSSVRKHLTPQRIAELTGPAPAPRVKQYTVEISGLSMPAAGPLHIDKKPDTGTVGPITFPIDRPGFIEAIREFAYPIDFDPPQATEDGKTLAAPVRPRGF